jgi:hypothetical protein
VVMGIQDLVVGERKRNQGLGQMSGASVQGKTRVKENL